MSSKLISLRILMEISLRPLTQPFHDADHGSFRFGKVVVVSVYLDRRFTAPQKAEMVMPMLLTPLMR